MAKMDCTGLSTSKIVLAVLGHCVVIVLPLDGRQQTINKAGKLCVMSLLASTCDLSPSEVPK